MRVPSKGRANLGKWAETQVQAWLTERSSGDWRFAFHRYPDARAARGALAAQPADFLVSDPARGTSHLEVKETAQRHRLPRAKVSQWGALYKFHLAGIPAYVLVYRNTCKDWVVLTAPDLHFNRDACPPSFPLEGLASFPTHQKALAHLYGSTSSNV